MHSIQERKERKKEEMREDILKAKIEAIKEFGKLLIDKIDGGVISHSIDIVDIVAEEIERLEKEYEEG